MTSELNNTQVKSREEFRKTRDEEKNTEKEPKKKREGKLRIRLIPIWIRLLLVVVLFAASVMIGVVVGYGVIGDGNPSDALKKETWQHIVDLVNKDVKK
ncbi:DNA-directed RNA polymerase subunit beta [Bacillus timonensis]|uniref:DNA-directed RNA polymerase subunit beta n=1 Tax=Bacillus timonensis TaxID=1033734 RepID=A0A4S3PKZ8_9BACI|nr:DNA-directed RNA polymerase subunit beta [Bacillus timonensis]THE09695.1 DNA-directed RNA polymerase subunit beta [Bacillus timonensis]